MEADGLEKYSQHSLATKVSIPQFDSAVPHIFKLPGCMQVSLRNQTQALLSVDSILSSHLLMSLLTILNTTQPCVNQA